MESSAPAAARCRRAARLWFLPTVLLVVGGCVDLTTPWDKAKPADGATAVGGTSGTAGTGGRTGATGAGGALAGAPGTLVGGNPGGGTTTSGQAGASGPPDDAQPGAGGAFDSPPAGNGGAGAPGQGGVDGAGALGGTGGTTIDTALGGAGGTGVPDGNKADLVDAPPPADGADGARDVSLDGPADAAPEATADTRDAASEPISTAGLIAYYPCEGTGGAPGTTLVDLSGNGNHGTITVGPPPATGGTGGSLDGGAGTGGTTGTPVWSYDPAKVGNGLTLSGAANTYVALPAGLLAGQQEMTIAAWVKPSTATAFQRVFDFSTDTTNFMYLATANSGNTAARFRIATPGGPTADGGISQVLEGNAPLVAGAWTHLALVLSATSANLYVNGSLQAASTTVTLRPADLGSTTSDTIGRSAFPKDPYFDGAIDEYRIYSRALSATEIASLASGN